MGSRAFNRRMSPVGRAVPGVDIEPLCNDVVRRIREIRLHTGAGTYMLADGNGDVFLLREQSTVADKLVKRFSHFLVGLYAAQVPIFPTPEYIASDLIEHFIEIGYIDRNFGKILTPCGYS